MVVFVTGGGGVLGRNLSYKLAKLDHEVHVIDADLTDVDRSKVAKVHLTDLTQINSLLKLAYAHKPKAIVHLAEIASIDTNLHVHAVRVNMGATAEMIHVCAKLDIRGVVGCWIPLHEHNMMTQSLNQKASMVRFYDRGNTVVNIVQIPSILHPDYPTAIFGTFVNRLFNNIELGQPFFIADEGEDSVHSYCTVHEVCDVLIDQIGRRTRKPHLIEGCRVDYLKEFVGIALDVFDCDSATLVGREEPREYQRIRGREDHPIHRWIKAEWASLIDTKGAFG